MSRTLFTLTCILSSFFLKAQSVNHKWGAEFKRDTKSIDPVVVYADEGGYYLFDGDPSFGDFLFEGFTKVNHSLMKHDINGKEIFEKSYRKELKGYGMHSIQALQDQLYIFVLTYEKGSSSFSLWGSGLNKQTGELTGDLKALGAYSYDKDNYEPININAAEDGSGFFITHVGRASVLLAYYDGNLKKQKGIAIPLQADKERFILDDIYFDGRGNIVTVGREWEFRTEGKKDKIRYLKQILYAIYDPQGKRIKEFTYSSPGLLVIYPMLLKENDSTFIMTARCLPDSNRNVARSILWQKLNIARGEIIQQHKQELGEFAFDNYFKLRDIYYEKTSSRFIFLYEYCKSDKITTPVYSKIDPMKKETTYYDKFKDILILTASKENGSLAGLRIPKEQEQIISGAGSSSHSSAALNRATYKKGEGGRGSFGYFFQDGKLFVLLNDNPANLHVKNSKSAALPCDWRNSALFTMVINMQDFLVTRKLVRLNENEILPHLSQGYIQKKTVYFYAQKYRLVGKNLFQFGEVRF